MRSARPRHAVRCAALFVPAAGRSNGSSTNPGPTASAPVAVVLGDSLTAGPGLRNEDAYPALLQERARWPITASVRQRRRVRRYHCRWPCGVSMPRWCQKHGCSSSRSARMTALQGVPVDTVKQNLRQIIQRARTRNISVLLAGMESPPNNGLDYSVRFHNIFPDLAAEFNVRLMPFLLQNVFGRPDLNLPDGLHPNAAGMRVIAAEMWPFLEPLLRAASSARPTPLTRRQPSCPYRRNWSSPSRSPRFPEKRGRS